MYSHERSYLLRLVEWQDVLLEWGICAEVFANFTSFSKTH